MTVTEVIQNLLAGTSFDDAATYGQVDSRTICLVGHWTAPDGLR